MIFLLILNLFTFSQYNEPVSLDALNSSADDFAPSYNFYENILYYNSDITGKSKFYICEDLANPKKEYLNHAINEIQNISFISFFDSEKAIVSSFIKYPSQAKLNLYYASKIKQNWIREKDIQEINGDYFILNATLSKDNSFMIFSSNKENSLKDTDLFISYKNELNQWGQPININELNSVGSEITPLLVGNDTLYFASNGQGGKGGYDIFMSYRTLGKWQRPVPLEEINSSFNDSDPCIINNKIIFASDRPGGQGKLDLYIAEKEEKSNLRNQIQDYEINLSTFVTTINVKTQSKINNKSVYPYIHFEQNDTKLLNSFQERNINTLKQIASFIKLGNKIELNVWTQNILENQKEINSKFISDQRVANILKFLKDEFNISEDNININYYYSNEIKDYIFIYSNDKFISVSEEFEKKVILEPENLIYLLEIMPEDSFSSYSIDLAINDNFSKQILISKENPLNSKIDLTNFSDKISGSDSLKIIVNIKNKINQEFSKEFLYQINNSYEKISTNLNKNSVSFFLISPKDIENENYYKILSTELKNKLNKKEYIIESSSDIPDFLKKLKLYTDSKFTLRINENLGKEIIIK